MNSWLIVLIAIVGSLALAWLISEALVRLRIGPTDRGGGEAS